MIVSIAMAVLPMPRSPMISSRCPRPIGIIESIALSPVWSGSFTGWRTMMPGACDSTLRVHRRALISPSPSIGRPSASTTRPMSAGPTGTSSTRAGAADVVAFAEQEVVAEDDGADVVFFEVEGERGDDFAGLGGGDLEHLAGHRLLEAVDAGDAVANLEDGADFFDIEDVQIRGFDLAEEDVLDLAGSERGVSGHGSQGTGFYELGIPTVWPSCSSDCRYSL